MLSTGSRFLRPLLLVVGILSFSNAMPYDQEQADWNLNQNQTATGPLDYWGEWQDHSYTPSPDNWRVPFYTLSLDRYANGDPSNDDANGTNFEHDWMSTGFRYGGDALGLMNDLDYIHGMGVKVIYLMGSPFINQPWMGDGYSPLDFTVLDHHHGVIDDWRSLIDAIHERDMYVVLDNTMTTLGDLIGFSEYLNSTAPFNWGEYDYTWKSDRRYFDFQPGSEEVECTYPRFWDDNGYLLDSNHTECRDSEFSLYGDLGSIGHFPVYENQLAKFGSVQDRLREWRTDVLDKIKHFSCIQIAMLDIDGFRMDKALQASVDHMAQFGKYQRECAQRYGKDNFIIIGEVVGTDGQSAIYYGRGKQPNMYATNFTEAATATNLTDASEYVRDFGLTGLDGTGFHYTIYGALTRFLGLDGMIGENGVDFVGFWNDMVLENDMVNAYTGEFDPRHLMGMTSQDVFRWPAIINGTQRQLLGHFITYLLMPGAPALYWGEEQSFYILDSTADNYVYGRQPMSSSRAWQLHGCYHLDDSSYVNFPLGPALTGCEDDQVSLDRKDPAHPVRNVIKRMYELRRQYATLTDGFYLETLSNKTTDIYLDGSGGLASPTGIWSIYRSGIENVQPDLQDEGVWLVYSNENDTKDFSFDCQDDTGLAMLSPYIAGTTVKNLFYPYDEYTLGNSSTAFNRTINETGFTGCLSSISMDAWGFKAFVPIANFTAPSPLITTIIPSHDERIISSVDLGETETISIEIHFNMAMSCDSVTDTLSVNSTTADGTMASINSDTISCSTIDGEVPYFVGQPAGLWKFTADLENVAHGIHQLTVKNASAENGSYTGAVDRFMFRIGASDNPIVFPTTGNYTTDILYRNEATNELYVSLRAPGADKIRYSTTWGSSWSSWIDYTSDNITLESQAWSGTSAQKWTGEHVMVAFWSQMASSSDHIQHADLSANQLARRWPHAFVLGDWNTWGYDNGLDSKMSLSDTENGTWTFDLAAEWPVKTTINVWGMNPGGVPDKTMQYGDIDADGVLDWLHPDTLSESVISIPDGPGMPHAAWKIVVNDGTDKYTLVPTGSAWYQLALSILLALVPLVTGFTAVWAFKKSFYQVKFNKVGIATNKSLLARTWATINIFFVGLRLKFKSSSTEMAAGAQDHSRTVLIATMEYEIEDWAIKIKIGGLGVMASLMGKALGHQNLIWVVPCVGGIDYPIDEVGEPMMVTINGTAFKIDVQYHVLRNITFVLLDAPIFRQQSKADPYPARMDDLDSAIYYSAWNACIAETMKRFPIDLYHINDYHGSLAPLYLLPKTIPVSLSLHNAEFQGMWSLRSTKEMDEITGIFNLPQDVVKKYVQFGEVFNLLHAGSSYLRIHQKGFGAVGVSKKYGTRALKRYPIFWGLSNIGALPNPDPSDVAEWNGEVPAAENVEVDAEAEAARGPLRMQAQEWAGLEQNPNAELFVFVGRWSEQKGVDLIADIFPALLDKHKDVQLICVGPVIDLYGKFAALKLQKIMDRYPGRVFSKPEFTALPPFIFSGAEFALIPSRDEPFGLVAVEFGRKGALGVGSRVGGLGQMPGWWFTIESMATKHLLRQFNSAIEASLASSTETRAVMRARSSLQRFPVAQWIRDLETLQSTSIHSHKSVKHGSTIMLPGHGNTTASRANSRRNSTSTLAMMQSPTSSRPGSPTMFDPTNAPPVPRLPNMDMPMSHHHYGALTPQTLYSPTNTAPSTAAPSRAPSIYGGRERGRDVTLYSPTNTAPSTAAPSRAPSMYGGRERGRDVTARRRAGTVGAIQSPIASEPPSGTSTPRNRSQSRPRAPQNLAVLGPRLTALAQLERNVHENTTPVDSPHKPKRDSGGSEASSSQRLSDPATYVNPAFNQSVLTVDMVSGGRKDFKMQNVDPFFNDPMGSYYKEFEGQLDAHDGSLSSNKLCVEEYLRKSEKHWFGRFYDAKLGKKSKVESTIRSMHSGDSTVAAGDVGVFSEGQFNEFDMSEDYKPPTGARRMMQAKVGDWPVYAFFLAFGQIIAANSYQITLLTGQNGQSANQLYIISSIFLAGSMIWWFLFRCIKSVYTLSLPFLFYGSAFFLLAIVPWVDSSTAKTWMQYTATGLYAVASSSGFLFFTQNFLTEGGTPVKTWVFRAATIQGTQQLYIAALWYWGTYVSTLTNSGSTASLITNTKAVTYIAAPIAALMWAVGLVILIGLPDAYRAKPGNVPAFYMSLLRRKVVVWFLVVVIIQNYWLSAPYGRSWTYLWSSTIAPAWAVAVLIAVFFVLVWALILLLFTFISHEHSWALPLFAIGLGAPRWAQMLWGVSGAGLYMPWAGHPAAGALLGRALWLWLGVLDTLQGVGFGMILLQTLTRIHMTCGIAAAQVLGALGTIAARASAPDRIGPGPVFPNLAVHLYEAVHDVWFWVPLLFQLAVCVGFFVFFRKEQLFKP